jgi:probable addiction module antidote protein
MRRTKIKTKPYDSAKYLDTAEARAAYMTEALATEDASFIAEALGTVAKASGMSAVAREAGLSRENLYRSLSGDTNTKLETVVRVLRALGVKLTAEPNAKLGPSR